MWELATGKPVGLPMDHSFVTDLEFSPDGKMLASSGKGGICLWEVRSGTLIRTGFGGHAEKIAFAPDGKSLISFGSDHNTRWDLDLASWQRQACVVANRNLTQKEWHDLVGELSYRQTCPGR